MRKYLGIFITFIAFVLLASSVGLAKPVKKSSRVYDFNIVEEDVKNTPYGIVHGYCTRSDRWIDDETGEEWDILVFSSSDQEPWPGNGYIEIRGGVKTWHSGKAPRSNFATSQTNSDDESNGIILNSFSNYLKVTLSSDDLNIRAVFYNMNGQEVFRYNSNGQEEIEIPIYQLQTGVYVVSLENSEMQVTKKLIITK